MPDTTTPRSEEISVVVKIVPIPGKEVELRQRMSLVAAASRVENGCIFYELFGDRGGSSDLYFLGEWIDQASLDAHNQTQHVKDFRKDQPELTSELTVTSLFRI